MVDENEKNIKVVETNVIHNVKRKQTNLYQRRD